MWIICELKITYTNTVYHIMVIYNIYRKVWHKEKFGTKKKVWHKGKSLAQRKKITGGLRPLVSKMAKNKKVP